MKLQVLEMTIEKLRAAAVELGQGEYRADQLADWVYGKSVADPDKMTNLPREFASQAAVLTSRPADRADSSDGTVKLLLELADGERVETVMIPAARRATACLSTQVGCPIGCGFCASGMDGVRRNLSSGEILEQIMHLQIACERRVSHVVFMGMGEPLANYRATLSAIRAIVDPRRFGISARHVTVSTVGLPKQILRLGRTNIPVTLAISLHAPNDQLRRRLIPGAPATIEEIVEAAREFFQSRKREVTLEYVMLAGVNDTPLSADALAKIAKQLRCNVNLIRYNPVESLPFAAPSRLVVRAFAQRLRKRGINAQIRHPRGLDAAAACGQLRRRNG